MLFRPMPFLTAFAVPSLCLLLWLGTWQVQRMEWKSSVTARIEAGLAAPPEPIDRVLAAAARGEDVAYRKVAVMSSPHAPAILEWGSEKRLFRFARAGEGLILLETGIGEPARGVFADTRTGPIIAILRPAERPNRFTPDNEPELGFWYWLDTKAMAAGISDPVWRASEGGKLVEANWYAAALSLCRYGKGDAGQTCTPTPNSRTDPKAETLSPERHLGYVITWWGLAAALVAVYLALHARAGRLSFR